MCAPQNPRLSLRPVVRLGVPALLTGLICLGGAPPRATAETDAPPPVTVEAPAEREDRLLHLLCRYLKLSRAQVLHLAPFSRQTSRGRDLLERECAERRRVFEPLAASQPEASERLRVAMEQRREAVLADLQATGTRALVRILTREQIALVWRLTQRNPPKYAQADPALLDPKAGFATGWAVRNLEVGFLLADPAAISGATGALGEAAPPRLFSGAGPLMRLPVDEALPNAARSFFQRSFQIASGTKPFPQLVAETNDPNDLLPALEPLAARVFSSDRWLPVLEEILRSGENPAGSRRPAAPGPLRLLRDFRMERGFRDLTGRGPALEPLGGDVQHGLYLFDPGQGLHVSDTGVTDHYAIQLNLLYHGGDSYQKILDFKNRTSDNGLYFYQGHLSFYTLADGGSPVPEREHRLRIERDRTTRTVRVSLDLRPVLAFVDLDGDAVFENGAGALFVDDTSTKNEQGAGALRSVNVWGPASPR